MTNIGFIFIGKMIHCKHPICERSNSIRKVAYQLDREFNRSVSFQVTFGPPNI